MATYSEMLQSAPEGSFHVLDPDKAKRMNGQTMYIPSSADVIAALSAIPTGETWTFADLRKRLAAKGGADVACPFITNRYWKWTSFAWEEPAAPELIKKAPWWRVLRDGKPNPKLLGGGRIQRDLLGAEGIVVK